MKKVLQGSLLSLVAILFMSTSLLAQEQTEVTVRIEKDGKIVKDTTYQFENSTDAEHAVRMMEILSGEGLKEMEYNHTMSGSDDDENNTMVFISKDGKKTRITDMEGDSLVWVSEGEDEEGDVKVMKYKVNSTGEGKHVVVVTSGSGGTYEVVIDEDEDGEPVTVQKRVKVIVTEDKEIKSKQ